MKNYSNQIFQGVVNVQTASTSAFKVGPIGGVKFHVDGSVTPAVYVLQGTSLFGYAGDYVGPTFILSAATGNLTTPGGISASSYGSSTGGVSRMYTNLANGALQVNTQGAANVGLIVQGAATQSVALQQWTDSAGTVKAYMLPSGTLAAANIIDPGATLGPYISLTVTGVSVINRTAIGNIPFTVRGMAGQTGNLQEWQSSAGTPLSRISAAGEIQIPSIAGVAGAGPYILVDGTRIAVTNRTAIGYVPLSVRGMAGQTGDLQQWWDNPTGTLLAKVNAAGEIVSSARVGIGNVPIIVKAMVGQTGDLTQWQDSNGNPIARIKATTAQTGTPAAATDLATALTLVNDLRTKLLNLGLIS